LQQRLKLKCDEPLSNVAFNVNVRRYTVVEASAIKDMVPATRTWLRRETVALAAQLAHLDMVGAAADGRDGRGGVGEHKTAAGKAAEHRDSLERARLRSAFRLIGCVEQYMQHEEEVTSPVEVFANVTANAQAITGTVGVLLTLVLVAMQRLFALVEQGWGYYGDMGEFVPSTFGA